MMSGLDTKRGLMPVLGTTAKLTQWTEWCVLQKIAEKEVLSASTNTKREMGPKTLQQILKKHH
jgi:hypothetical protein